MCVYVCVSHVPSEAALGDVSASHGEQDEKVKAKKRNQRAQQAQSGEQTTGNSEQTQRIRRRTQNTRRIQKFLLARKTLAEIIARRALYETHRKRPKR